MGDFCVFTYPESQFIFSQILQFGCENLTAAKRLKYYECESIDINKNNSREITVYANFFNLNEDGTFQLHATTFIKLSSYIGTIKIPMYNVESKKLFYLPDDCKSVLSEINKALN